MPVKAGHYERRRIQPGAQAQARREAEQQQKPPEQAVPPPPEQEVRRQEVKPTVTKPGRMTEHREEQRRVEEQYGQRGGHAEAKIPAAGGKPLSTEPTTVYLPRKDPETGEESEEQVDFTGAHVLARMVPFEDPVTGETFWGIQRTLFFRTAAGAVVKVFRYRRKVQVRDKLGNWYEEKRPFYSVRFWVPGYVPNPHGLGKEEPGEKNWKEGGPALTEQGAYDFLRANMPAGEAQKLFYDLNNARPPRRRKQ